ncbi:lysophospholipid acyltransferase family protein [Porticoccus sp. GXU_MW_L64]
MNPVKTAFYGIRSALFYITYVPCMTFFSSCGFTIGQLVPYKTRHDIVSLGTSCTNFWLRVCCGVKIETVGKENIPDGPMVILAKHQSTWETYHMQRLFRPVSTILKKELLSIPIFGWGLSKLHPIGIDRGNPRAAMKQIMAQGKERLAEGNNVVIYPEGTRVDPGEKGKYARSGAALAIEAGVPVVPLAHNAGLCWPGRRFLKFPGTITVVIGEPIATEGLTSKELTERAESWIERQQAVIDRP